MLGPRRVRLVPRQRYLPKTTNLVSSASGYTARAFETYLEISKGLRELQWLDDNTFLLFVISNFSVPGQGEILAQWVAVKTVVGHDSPQIRVACEENTKHIVHLSLVPIGSVVQACDARNRACLIGISLHSEARVVPDAKHIVNDFETLVPCRVVDGGDVGDLGILCRGVVLEECKDGNDTLGRYVDCQLVLPDRELLNVFGQAGGQILSVFVEGFGLVCGFVGGVDDGRMESSGSIALEMLDEMSAKMKMVRCRNDLL